MFYFLFDSTEIMNSDRITTVHPFCQYNSVSERYTGPTVHHHHVSVSVVIMPKLQER